MTAVQSDHRIFYAEPGEKAVSRGENSFLKGGISVPRDTGRVGRESAETADKESGRKRLPIAERYED